MKCMDRHICYCSCNLIFRVVSPFKGIALDLSSYSFWPASLTEWRCCHQALPCILFWSDVWPLLKTSLGLSMLWILFRGIQVNRAHYKYLVFFFISDLYMKSFYLYMIPYHVEQWFPFLWATFWKQTQRERLLPKHLLFHLCNYLFPNSPSG